MAEELAYVLVTPHSVRKSRTGGIIARLISRTGLDLVRARMFAPSVSLIEEFSSYLVNAPDPAHRKIQELIRDYVRANFMPSASGAPARVMMLVFQGDNAVVRVKAAVGAIVNERTSGETIRDTYGDYATDANGNVVYFEPAALASPSVEAATATLKLWARYSDTDGGILSKAVQFPPDATVEKTLVLIKPDNFRFPNVRPGGVIDVFSRTGLYIVGMKVHFMSVAQACEFYGPVLDVLKNLLKDRIAAQAVPLLEKELGLTIDPQSRRQLGELLGPIGGQINWEAIIKFMTGATPSELPREKWNDPGTEKCIALVYQGVDAVRKIREVLGPTDPSKAPPGSIRKEFGQTIMVNAAHASDSADNARREMGIIQIEENNLKPFVENFYGGL